MPAPGCPENLMEMLVLCSNCFPTIPGSVSSQSRSRLDGETQISLTVFRTEGTRLLHENQDSLPLPTGGAAA